MLRKKSYKPGTIIKRTVFPEGGLRNVALISYTVMLREDDLTSHRGILLLLNNCLSQ